jgi:hypothetical protein
MDSSREVRMVLTSFETSSAETPEDVGIVRLVESKGESGRRKTEN